MRTQNLMFKKGYQASVQVGTAYTAQTTYAGFQSSGAEGEICVVKESDETIYSGSALIPAGTTVFIAVKRNGLLQRQPSFTIDGNFKIAKTVGVAQQAQITQVRVYYPTASPNPDWATGYYIGIVNTEERDNFFPEFGYNISAKTRTETYRQMIDRLITDFVRSDTNIQNMTLGKRFDIDPATVTVVDAGDGTSYVQFFITGLMYGGVQQMFRPVVNGFYSFTTSNTQEAESGVNLGKEVKEHEWDGMVFDGKTSYLEVMPPFVDESGKPNPFVVSDSALYTSYLLTWQKSEMSSAFGTIDQHVNNRNNLVFVPNGSTAVTKFDTMFGAS